MSKVTDILSKKRFMTEIQEILQKNLTKQSTKKSDERNQ